MDPKKFKQKLLDQLYEKYKSSVPCHLSYHHRRNIVFGEGNPAADLMLIGEAPGEEEDKQGRPFVGRSGQLLNRVLEKVGIVREDVYITNVVKCRPPNNRAPSPEEIKICKEMFLDQQIKIIRPKIIATLGSIALNALLGRVEKITKVHGSFIKQDGYILIPLYHPAYVLRNASVAESWLEDFKKVKTELNKVEHKHKSP